MAMNITYSSDLYTRSWRSYLPTFGMERRFHNLKGLRLTFGMWVKLTTDRVHGTSDLLSSSHATRAALYSEVASDEFRLLVLSPWRKGNMLQAHLVAYPIREAPPFAAVSYVWGDPSNPAEMLLNGVIITIRRNMAQFLRRQSESTESVYLWIDMLCINQDDLDEKNSQVSMMGTIYTIADTVKVWLGEESEHSPTGMAVLEYFSSRQRPAKDAPWQVLPAELVRKGLGDIMKRPWWYRMWVVQEFVLSRQVQLICGSRHTSFPTTEAGQILKFQRMIKYAVIHPDWQEQGLQDIDMGPLLELLDLLVRQQIGRSSGISRLPVRDILDVAYDMRHRLTTDRRDMIFALHGLVKDQYIGEGLIPDYSRSVTDTFAHLEEVIEW